MPAGEPDRRSRRTALTGLAAMLATGCGRLEFMAANVPAAFGAYQQPRADARRYRGLRQGAAANLKCPHPLAFQYPAMYFVLQSIRVSRVTTR